MAGLNWGSMILNTVTVGIILISLLLIILLLGACTDVYRLDDESAKLEVFVILTVVSVVVIGFFGILDSNYEQIGDVLATVLFAIVTSFIFIAYVLVKGIYHDTKIENL